VQDFIVAIDGGAGSGKSTTAKGVAKVLRFFYLDTGAMYRAVTLKYLRRNGPAEPIDMKLVHSIIRETSISLKQENTSCRVFCDAIDVTREIRTPQVNVMVSPVSAIPEIREWMVEKQREVAKGKNVVCEGRDIGTVVFPEAQVKIFMYADLDVRAQRRLREFNERSIEAKFEEVIDNLKYRDNYDSSRAHSPLKKAKDAITIDTTYLTIEQEIDAVVKIVREKISF
jgi:cytidylate kinase